MYVTDGYIHITHRNYCTVKLVDSSRPRQRSIYRIKIKLKYWHTKSLYLSRLPWEQKQAPKRPKASNDRKHSVFVLTPDRTGRVFLMHITHFKTLIRNDRERHVRIPMRKSSFGPKKRTRGRYTTVSTPTSLGVSIRGVTPLLRSSSNSKSWPMKLRLGEMMGRRDLTNL